MSSIRFLGAAQNVTGSCYVLEACGKRVMIDCGLYQEREFKDRNWEELPLDVSKLDAVVMTHAHLDHCGRLPRLVKQGFRGPIYCTSATSDLIKVVLLDCAKINVEDAEFKQRRHEREGRQGPHPVLPLYTEDDVKKVVPLLKPVAFGKVIKLGNLSFSFAVVGHILGAAFIRFVIKEDDGTEKTVVFSGDVGRPDMPILEDPTLIGKADYVVCESTYGDRLHGSQADIPNELAEVINDTVKRGGNLIIPCFAIERTQEMMYFLAQLIQEDRIPHLRIFVDSPMAVKVSEIFGDHQYLYDAETKKLVRDIDSSLSGLTMVRTQADSKSINHIRGSAIIMAGAGMCTGGRIKHHLAHHIDDEGSTVLFVGYQAQGTLGRIILEGATQVRIQGQMFDVNARIAQIDGFSAHGDMNELTTWLKSVMPPPKKVIVTHGEYEAAHAFAAHVTKELGCEAVVPSYLDTIEL